MINEALLLKKVEMMEAHSESAKRLAVEIKGMFAKPVKVKKNGLSVEELARLKASRLNKMYAKK